MEYTITTGEERKYILITVRGEINGEMAAQITQEAHALGRELGIDKFLQDLTECRNLETETQNYTFARKDLLRQKGINYAARLAMLVRPEDTSHDFVATVAHNSGLDVRLFHDRDEALRYLFSERSAQRISSKPATRRSERG